jgi:hypothetical protein
MANPTVESIVYLNKTGINNKNIARRYINILRAICDFSHVKNITQNVIIDTKAVKIAVHDYFIDIARIKEFHNLSTVNFEKTYSYMAYWLLKRKPLQVVTSFPGSEFINELFITAYLLSNLLAEKRISSTQIAKNPTFKKYQSLLFYNLRYHTLTQETIELMIEAFFCGCDFSTSVELTEQEKERLEKYLADMEKQNQHNLQMEQENSKIEFLQTHIKEIINFHQQNEQNLNELIELIKEHRVTPFIGAGLSKFAGYPLWKEFLQSIYNKHKQKIISVIAADEFERKSCAEQAKILKHHLGVGIIEQILENEFSEKKVVDVDNDASLQEQSIYLIPDLFTGLILTTNFDKLIELVFSRKKSIQINSFSLKDIKKMHDMRNDIWVYKLHGTIDDIDTIILTQDDYKEYYREETECFKELNRQMNGKDILFLGCSLEEDNEIMPFYEHGKNYAICDCLKDKINDKEIILSRKRIRPILYPPTNNHFYHKVIMEYIVERVNKNILSVNL